jgi:hypothetical protein
VTRNVLAALLGAGTFVLYVFALPPGVDWWDTGEFQTVPYIAGILHPTGFPAYAIIGWLFSHLFVVGNVAWRMSVMSALAGSGAAATLAYTIRKMGGSSLAALAGTLLFVTSDIVFVRSTRAGVESLTLLFAALAVANAVAWYTDGRANAMIRSGLFLGLALATHLIALWFIPGIVVLLVAGSIRRNARLPAALAACALLGALALYAYLPLRGAMITNAHLDPAATVLGLSGQPFWDTDSPQTLPGFIRLVTGADFHTVDAFGALRDPANIPQYFLRFAQTVVSQYHWAGAIIAIIGLIALFARPPLALGLLLTAILVVPFSMTYGVLIDPDKYYLMLLWLIALFVSRGVTAFGRFEAAPALLVAAAIGINLAHSGHIFAQRSLHNGESLIADVRDHTEANAIVIAGWSYATPLAYAAYVEKDFGDRIPVSSGRFDDISRWTAIRPVYYLPFPENDTKLPGVRLERIANTSPPLYRLRALSSQAR